MLPPLSPAASAVARGVLAGLAGTAARALVVRGHEAARWGYGAGLGCVRGVLDTVGLGRNTADTAFQGVVWGAEQALLPALGLAPFPRVSGRADGHGGLMHHGVYALTTNAVYRWLSPSDG